MKQIILAGATGNLGLRVLKHLHSLGSKVRCIVRQNSAADAIKNLLPFASEVMVADYEDIGSLAKACKGGEVVVSTVSGLRPVIVDFQSRLLQAAVDEGVSRFIPSDFAIDYRTVPRGENRNLNLREDFRQIIDSEKRIRATSILNGAFMDMLTGVAPFILYRFKRTLCWGDRDQLMDWTTIDDTARFTAYAAIDNTTPRFLTISGDELSAAKLASIMTDLSGKKYKIIRPAGLGIFKFMITMTKLTTPDQGKTYPPWQGMQYMYSMYKGDCKFKSLDNSRYPMKFTTAKEMLKDYLSGSFVKYTIKD